MSTSVIGQPVTRIDGKLKVTGRATYAVEHPIENVAYGVAVASTIGTGALQKLTPPRLRRCPVCSRFCITATSKNSTIRRVHWENQVVLAKAGRPSKMKIFMTGGNT